MRIAVTGSSGLIGSALVRSLLADGHQVVRLVRRHGALGPQPDGSVAIGWNPALGQLDRAGLAGTDAVVHLAGAGVGDRRWTDAYKREIRDSRLLGTRTLAVALAEADAPPAVLVSASAVGYYGQTGDRVIDESAPAGDDFLARVCVDWEGAARPPPRRASGGAPAHRAGALRQGRRGGRLFPLFKLGLGARLGSGDQYWSFISLADQVAALRFMIDHQELSGPVNLTAPQPVTNRELTAALGRVLRRPTPFVVPEAVLRLALGEMAVEVIGSHRVVPAKLLAAGFTFAQPEVDDAVRAAL